MSYTKEVLRWLVLASLPMMAAGGAHPVHAESLPEVIKSPASYNGKSVSVRGVAGPAEQKWSSEGNPYTVFNLSDSGQTLLVYKGGHLYDVSTGSSVLVTGKFVMAFASDGLKAPNVIEAVSVQQQ